MPGRCGSQNGVKLRKICQRNFTSGWVDVCAAYSRDGLRWHSIRKERLVRPTQNQREMQVMGQEADADIGEGTAWGHSPTDIEGITTEAPYDRRIPGSKLEPPKEG